MLDLNSFEQGNFDLNIDSNKDLNPNPNSGFNNMNIDDEEQKRILARQKEDEERKERINKYGSIIYYILYSAKYILHRLCIWIIHHCFSHSLNIFSSFIF